MRGLPGFTSQQAELATARRASERPFVYRSIIPVWAQSRYNRPPGVGGHAMEMHQVRYFLAAAKALSFTRAAEVCHVSQPALTTAIKKLEAQLGSPLFHREGRQVALTEFGRRMQPHLSQILEQEKAAEAVAKDFRLLNQ